MAKEKTNYTEPEERIPENNNGNIPNPTIGGEEEPIEIKDPLTDAPKIERDHTSGGMAGGSNQPQREYVPDFTIPTEDNAAGAGATSAIEEPEFPGYEDMKGDDKMTPEQQKENAEVTAEVLLSLYGETKRRVGNLFLPISEKTLIKLQEEGEIDLSIPINYGGVPTPGIGIINGYNNLAYNRFGLREKFVEKAKPILANLLAKKGWVMTPEMYLGYLVFVDISKDVEIGVQLKGKANEILAAIKEMTAAYRGGGYSQQPGTGNQEPPPPDMPPPPVVNHHVSPSARVEDTFSAIQSGEQQAYAGNASPVPGPGIQPGRSTPMRPIRKKKRGKYNKKKATL